MRKYILNQKSEFEVQVFPRIASSGNRTMAIRVLVVGVVNALTMAVLLEVGTQVES